MLSYVTRASAGLKVWLATLAGEIKLYNGLRPGEKRAKARGEEPAAHGGEDCAARRVKTKADALGIGGQAPICRVFNDSRYKKSEG